jgi:hypothetical protein
LRRHRHTVIVYNHALGVFLAHPVACCAGWQRDNFWFNTFLLAKIVIELFGGGVHPPIVGSEYQHTHDVDKSKDCVWQIGRVRVRGKEDRHCLWDTQSRQIRPHGRENGMLPVRIRAGRASNGRSNEVKYEGSDLTTRARKVRMSRRSQFGARTRLELTCLEECREHVEFLEERKLWGCIWSHVANEYNLWY